MKKMFSMLLLALCMLATQPVLAFDTTLDDELLMLVNSTYQLEKAYEPDGLVNTSTKTLSTKGRLLLREPAANAYYDMISAYKKISRRPLYSISGYRDWDYQQRLFTTKMAGRQSMGQTKEQAYANTLEYTALPGTSEHQTGLAVDLSSNNQLFNNFRSTVQGKWLMDNCWDFGYILRYDEAKSDITAIAYEPWHYRYVGLPHSLIIRDNNWVLEEYISYLQENGSLEYADPEDESFVWHIYWTNDVTTEFSGITNVSRDNTGGYIITCKCPKPELLLSEWGKEALSGNGIMRYI